jgi:hypothetical protein
MTDTPNLALPYIEASQAQKHVTHNEALRILDAAIQIAVQDMTRTTPPAGPTEGERHVVAAGAAGAWTGQGHAIATWQDGAWAFLMPRPGWCVWSIADDGMMVFDGTAWRAVGTASLDSVAHLGINTSADSSNLLSVKSNAALFAARGVADGGSGDVRLQLSKESTAKTASVVFADNFSGRAEFGLVGSDMFKLKVSPDGTSFIEAFTVDPSSGNLALPRGLMLSGVIAPAQITANQNDYSPAGLGAAAVLQVSSDAARSVSGLATGAEGRIVTVLNVGGQPITLLDESTASTAANRFTLGGNLVIAAKQAALLRYDGTAARWQTITGGLALRADGAQALSALQQAQVLRNAGLPSMLRSYLAGLTLSTAGASTSFGVAAGVATDSGNADMMTLTAALTKTTAAWAAGSAAGALDAGAIAANTWYHVHLIKRADTGAVDVLVSTSAGAPTLPAAYSLARRIGSMKTNGAAQWVKFVQTGDKFLLDVAVNDINVLNPGTAAATRTLPSTPPGVVNEAILSVTAGASAASDVSAAVYINDLAMADPSPLGVGGAASFEVYNGGTGQLYGGAVVYVNTNISQQVRSKQAVSGPTTVFSISVLGWIDVRGRWN